MTIDINTLSYEDIIDVRDIIERIEELDNLKSEEITHDEVQELVTLKTILKDLKGNGGDEQWRGDWYPVTLIRESYFREYCLDLCHDIGAIPRDLPDYIEIDWEATARNLKVDYTSTEIDGVTYFYR